VIANLTRQLINNNNKNNEKFYNLSIDIIDLQKTCRPKRRHKNGAVQKLDFGQKKI